LWRISGSFVIGRNTAFTYRGKPVALKQIGRELSVRYVLEGSVQRGANRMRVSVQLIDAESGNHLWAERFDKPLADLFDMQDEIVARLANALDSQLIVAEARRAERAPNPDSMDLWFQGRSWWNKGITPINLATARHLYERALALDPANVRALVGVAAVDSAVAVLFVADDRIARLTAAETALTKALSLGPENPFAHLCLGVVQTWTNRPSQGIRECERALELDRNLANAHGQIGIAKVQLGQAKDTETHIQAALRLSPRDAFAYQWCSIAGRAKLHLGEVEEAIAWLRRSIETNGNYPMSHFFLAAALARLGRLPEACSEARTGLAINPTFTIPRFCASAASENSTAAAGRELIIEGLRKAGVPEE
jgi:tetratricopeptide (TPR) repeat protein